MSITKLGLISLALVAVSGNAALAHDTAPIDRTLAIQLQQIQDGRRNGSLTRHEYEALVAEQARIADMERRALSNGVTGREYRAIRGAQHEAAAHIAEDSSNGRVNIWRRWKARHGL